MLFVAALPGQPAGRATFLLLVENVPTAWSAQGPPCLFPVPKAQGGWCAQLKKGLAQAKMKAHGTLLGDTSKDLPLLLLPGVAMATGGQLLGIPVM